MSNALWCDFGNHAFSARDKGKKNLVIEGEDEMGDPTSETWTACSEHAPITPAAAVKGQLTE